MYLPPFRHSETARNLLPPRLRGQPEGKPSSWPPNDDSPDGKAWAVALTNAQMARFQVTANPAPGADSHFDISIAPPAWATPHKFVKQIGRLRFYNLDRDHEQEESKSKGAPASRR
jgi:hypothetical protein